MAQGLLAHHLATTGAADVAVFSAGLLEGGQPASPHAVAVLAARGYDLSGHLSRQLSAELVAGSDLILGMERRHLRAAAVLAPGAFDRTFTLREFIRRGLAVGPCRAPESFVAWLGRLNENRLPEQLLADNLADDVADPVGAPIAEFEKAADELDLLVRGVKMLILS